MHGIPRVPESARFLRDVGVVASPCDTTRGIEWLMGLRRAFLDVANALS